MNKLIEIHDDLIPIFLQNKIEELIFSDNLNYFFIQNITFGGEKNDNLNFGFNHVIYNCEDNNSTSPYIHLFNQILYTFCTKRNIILDHIFTSRAFLQTPSLNPGPQPAHQDVTNKGKIIPHLVCLYYVNDSDGDTVFYKDDKSSIFKTVSPKKGRIIFFDGSIFHGGGRPSKTHRAILNFDITGKVYN